MVALIEDTPINTAQKQEYLSVIWLPFVITIDANGNVTELVDGNGLLVVTYVYDAFGNIIANNDIYASGAELENRFKFSTKYQDDETALSYYGYRYYDAEFGRWLSRDPIGEDGFISLNASRASHDEIVKMYRLGLEPFYLFTRNAPVNQIDAIGLQTPAPQPPVDDGPGSEWAWALRPRRWTCAFLLDLRFHPSNLRDKIFQTMSGAGFNKENGRYNQEPDIRNLDDTVVNAVLHCTLMCAVASTPCCSPEDATELGEAHERRTGGTPESQAMDLANNAVGVAIGEQTPAKSSSLIGCVNGCIDAAKNGRLTWIRGLPNDPWVKVPTGLPNNTTMP